MQIKIKSFILSLLLILSLTACDSQLNDNYNSTVQNSEVIDNYATDAPSPTISPTATPLINEISYFNIEDVPEYNGEPYVIINDNIPFFSDEEITDVSFEDYSKLDSLGRCGTATASIGIDIMPTEDRESISSVYPTGWVQATYDNVDASYLYNRCHLIGFQLTAENANELNLITGTRYLNVDGMLPFENMVADYIKETENHVYYRVTPIFEGGNLVASGVLIEAKSVEDDGADILFCVYCYNVQPDIYIDYATGESYSLLEELEPTATPTPTTSEEITYILNTNSMKFHETTCGSVSTINDKNKEETTLSREELIALGYLPCGNCNP